MVLWVVSSPDQPWAPTPAQALCSAFSPCPSYSATAAVVPLTGTRPEELLAKPVASGSLPSRRGPTARTQSQLGGPQASAPVTHLQNGAQVPLPVPTGSAGVGIKDPCPAILDADAPQKILPLVSSANIQLEAYVLAAREAG